MKYIKMLLFFIILFSVRQNVEAQQADTSIQKKRLKPLIITSTLTYGVTMVALNELWYSDFERTSFHFFDDNDEWKQMDKAGHFYTAFQISSGGYEALQWAGLESDKAMLYSSLTSLVVISSIEVFDGFSAAYGASVGDLIANTTGAGFFYVQKKLWNETRLHPKYSFRATPYPAQRPEALGNNISEQIIKDYNGQTYWISADISKLLRTERFPQWLNVAFGYGAHDFIYARDEANIEAGFSPRRQFYLALDLDFNEYNSKSSFINTLIHVINMIHLPAPALEFSNGEFKFHYLF